jgi:hypothetical protein
MEHVLVTSKEAAKTACWLSLCDRSEMTKLAVPIVTRLVNVEAKGDSRRQARTNVNTVNQT